MYDIMIAFVLFIFAIVIGRQSRINWSTTEYAIYYTIWLLAAFLGTYGFVTTFLE